MIKLFLNESLFLDEAEEQTAKDRSNVEYESLMSALNDFQEEQKAQILTNSNVSVNGVPVSGLDSQDVLAGLFDFYGEQKLRELESRDNSAFRQEAGVHIPSKITTASGKLLPAWAVILQLYMATYWYPSQSDEVRKANEHFAPTYPDDNADHYSIESRIGIHQSELFRRSGVPNFMAADTYGQTMMCFEKMGLVETRRMSTISTDDENKARQRQKTKTSGSDILVFPGKNLKEWIEGGMEFNGDVTWTGRNGNEVRITPPQGKLNLSEKWVDSADGRAKLGIYSKSRTNTMGYRTKDSAETDAEEGTGLKASTNLPAADEFKNKTFSSFKSQEDRDKATKISAFSDEDETTNSSETVSSGSNGIDAGSLNKFKVNPAILNRLKSKVKPSEEPAQSSTAQQTSSDSSEEDPDLAAFYKAMQNSTNESMSQDTLHENVPTMYCPSDEELARISERKKFIAERAEEVVRKYDMYLKENHVEGYPVFASIVEDICIKHDVPFEDGVYAVANYARGRK